MPRVAAVYLNRLRVGMRLQADPTLVYYEHTFDGQKFGEVDLTRADLQQRHPYNTYVHYGLPPGPIGLPSRAALQAVAQPLTTDELFFVADGQGGHVFSRTYAEHKRHVQRYLQQRREAAR